MRRACLTSVLVWSLIIAGGCATASDPKVAVTQGNGASYPPAIEQSPARQQQAADAWRSFLSEYGVDPVTPDLDPILAIPRALPAPVAQRIRLSTKNGALEDAEVKETLKRFLSKNMSLVAGEQSDRPLTLQDLSLERLVNEGSFYRANYRQMNYPYPLANGYGELQLTIGRDGRLLQLSSRLLPAVEFGFRPQVDISRIAAGLRGRQFTYSGIDGRPLQYRVETAEEIVVQSLVIYPKESSGRMQIHLAYPVEVGSSMKWTVYIDAITGQEIDIRQNFNT